jgi:diguanylate cyclase (GGDEF)-like protein
MPWRLLWLLLAVNSILEFGVMAVLGMLPAGLAVHGWAEAVVDSMLLSLLLFPVLFHFLLRPLVRHIDDLERTDTELRGLQGQLELRVQQRTAELERRHRETRLLADMSHGLQSCATQDEACALVTRAAGDLFPGSAGVLWVHDAPSGRLQPRTSWGEPAGARDESPPPGDALRVPMIAQGETVGMIQIHQPEAARSDAVAALDVGLAQTLAEYAGLALTNLELRQTLREQSVHDPLTGLFNRRYLEEVLEREIRRAERSGDPLGIVMLDVDHFKRFNDCHGHGAGDRLLGDLGALLSSQVRGADIACRYGGEEFLLILPGMHGEVVRQRVEALREGVGQLHERQGIDDLAPVTVSAGIAMFPEHAVEAQALLRAADRALYRAKAEGRDRVVVIDVTESRS